MLVRKFPGVYTLATAADSHTHLAALSAWLPDAVITGKTAWQVAAGSLPPLARDLGPTVVHRRIRTRPRPGVRVRRRVVNPDDVLHRGGIRLHGPVAAAVELASTDEGQAIDTLLREHRLDPTSLLPHASPHHFTTGNATRKKIVAASLRNPYSYAERLLHRLFDKSRIGGWVANEPLTVGGRTVIPDARIKGTPVLIEFDGRRFHGGDRFESDRARQNLLVSHGYVVLRFTWDMLHSAPDQVIATVRRTLKRLCVTPPAARTRSRARRPGGTWLTTLGPSTTAGGV